MKIKKILIIILASAILVLIGTSALATNVGMPANVSRTSLMFCSPTPTPTLKPTPTQPPPPPDGGTDICICLIWIAITIIAFVLGILVGYCIKKCRRKKRHNPCFKDDDYC